MSRLSDLQEKYPITREVDPQPWLNNISGWPEERYYYESDSGDDEAPDDWTDMGWIWRPRPEYAQERAAYRGLDLSPWRTQEDPHE